MALASTIGGEEMTMKALQFVGFLAYLGACGSGGDDEPGGAFEAPSGAQCSSRTGAYTLRFVERQGGDCGAIPDQIVTSGGMQDPSCKGGPVDDDACTITSDVSCSFTDGTQSRLAGQIRWNPASTMASGTWQLTMTDSASNVLCQSIYDVTATR